MLPLIIIINLVVGGNEFEIKVDFIEPILNECLIVDICGSFVIQLYPYSNVISPGMQLRTSLCVE